MLACVFCIALAQGHAIGIQPMEKQGVEFVVSHDTIRRASFHERHHSVQHGSIIRVGDASTGVNEIAEEGDVGACRGKTQARLEPVRIGVQIGDDDGLRQMKHSCRNGGFELSYDLTKDFRVI
jgi:hypothetical protein